MGHRLRIEHLVGLRLGEVSLLDGDRARRAAYVGDYLYVFGDSSLTVVDERTWTETARVPL